MLRDKDDRVMLGQCMCEGYDDKRALYMLKVGYEVCACIKKSLGVRK